MYNLVQVWHDVLASNVMSNWRHRKPPKWAKEALAEARSSGQGAQQKETKIMMKLMRKNAVGKNTFDGVKDPFFRDYIDRFEVCLLDIETRQLVFDCGSLFLADYT